MNVKDVTFTIDLKGEELERYLAMKKFRDECDNPYFTVIPDNHPLRISGEVIDTEQGRA